MENDLVPSDPPQQNLPAHTSDPLIRYSVFAALGCAGLCMVFTILYIFSYSLDTTLSFERHFDSYLAPGNAGNLSTVLGLHMAQNRMFLQSCGMVAGIFFAFVGLALFLLGIQGTVDANGQIRDYSASARRLLPGGVILVASMIFVGVSAMHPIDFVFGPNAPAATIIAPTATEAPTQQPTTPATTQPATQSQNQPAQQQPAHLAPQSAPIPAQGPVLPKPLTASQPSAQPTQATAAAQRRPTRVVLARIKQPAPPPSTQHRFQP